MSVVRKTQNSGRNVSLRCKNCSYTAEIYLCIYALIFYVMPLGHDVGVTGQ